jgi:threonine/homoserine/homoserine lactone efflux protein
MELSTWLSLAFICMVGAMSPGPSLAVVLRHSMYNSAKHGIVASVAHGIGVGIYAALSLAGLASLINHVPIFYNALVYGGAAYLAYMGIRILMSHSSGLDLSTSQALVSYKQAAQDGFAIAFLNPKLAIFFVALFSQFIDPETMTIMVAMIMCTTVLLIDTVWYFIISIGSAKARDKFDLTKQQPIIDKILGMTFLILALRVLVNS